MTQEPVTADLRAPVFFLSYAHQHYRLPEPAKDVNQRALQLYVDLSEHVYELLGLPPGRDAGFMDRELDGGQKWSAELAYAVGSCQVFIPLLSPQYLISEWCAREWDAFTRRPFRAHPGATPSPGETSVIPVIWSYVDPRRLPPEIQQVQVFSPARLPSSQMAALYREEGLYGLLNLGREGREAYDVVVWRLAQRVAAAFGTHHVEPRDAQDFVNLRGRFGEGER